MKAGFTQSAVAEELRVHKSTISREINRNRGLRGYRPKQAQEKTMARRSSKYRPHIPHTTRLLVDDRIKRDWSPEQISGRLFLERELCVRGYFFQSWIESGFLPSIPGFFSPFSSSEALALSHNARISACYLAPALAGQALSPLFSSQAKAPPGDAFALTSFKTRLMFIAMQARTI